MTAAPAQIRPDPGDATTPPSASPRKILIVIIDLVGGTGAYCRLLATGLERYYPGQFVIDVLICRAAGVTPEDHRLFHSIQVLNTVIHTGWLRAADLLLHSLRIRRAIRRLRPDVILPVHTYANLLVSLVAPAQRSILTVHGAMTGVLATSSSRQVISWMMRRRYRRHLVIGPCLGVTRDLEQHFGAGETQVIYHGVDDHRIVSLAEQPADDLPELPYFLGCGRLVAQKNFASLIRAYALARKRGAAHDLVIVGEGDQRTQLEQLARELGVAAHVHLMGHRDNPFPCFRHADFFALSSVWEGFGLVLLEAMTLGLPCISADCPAGPGEILSDGRDGLLVPMNDDPALADAIVRLSTDPGLRQRLSSQSQRRAGELSLQRMAEQYRDLFLRIEPWSNHG